MMMTSPLHIFATLCVVCCALSAAESATVIPAFDRFGRATHADPVVSGLVLFDALNCVSCHALDDRQSLWITPKRAPDLASIGSRTNPEWLQAYLESPAHTVPGIRMPDVLHGFPEAERRVAAEAIVHFLLSQRPQTFQRTAPDRAAIARGENLFHSVGCVACHAPQKAELKGTVSNSQVLPRMSEKWAFDPLRRFLLDPRSIRPDGRMPSLGLSDNEAADIAHYLLRETQVAGILECSLYRGRINSLDQLEDAEWTWSGHVNDFSLDRVRRERNYALRFSGFIRAEQDAGYTFYLKSGGDSLVRIDGSLVAEARNNHSSASGTIHLSAGWHEIALEYLDHGHEALITLEWEAPGITRQPISSAMLRTTREAVSEPPNFVVNPAKAKDGRAYFAAMGCAACHDMKDIPKPVPPRNLSALQRGGCLAEHPGAVCPDFHLDAAQRDALSAALAALQSPTLREPSAKQKLAHSLLSLNCYACHSREKVGGASSDRDALFTSNVDDSGDEGRLPPHLDGVGDKLRLPWIEYVLTQGGRVRKQLNTRMPQFGAAHVGGLAELFVKLDRKEQPLKPAEDTLDVQKETGRKLVGTDGFSCIVCHRFNGAPGHTLQFVDLTTVPDRLNADWFFRFMPDPAKYHPGTRMPTFWPEGISSAPKILYGSTDRQIAALWAYLMDGPRAKFPEGLSRRNMELIVGGEAVVYRGKMWEAGYRAVATGFPERINLAFDAEELRLAVLWRGQFLNASPHWSVQGMGQIRPLGTNVVILPHGPALAVLANATTPWPTESGRLQGSKFGGYSLDSNQRPTLHYSIGKIDAEDFFRVVKTAGEPAFLRTLSFSGGPVDGLYFRAAKGKLARVAANTWRLNDTLTLRVPNGEILRGESDKQELLVPIQFNEGRGKVEIEYEW